MKNLLKVILIGATFGVTVLMVTYVSIYYIAGQEVFLQEISQLEQIETLQSQIVIVGVCGSLLGLAIYNIEKTRKSEKQSTYKWIVAIIVFTIVFIITIALTEKMNKNISDMIVIIETIAFGVYMLVNCAREVIDEFIINKKIKEKNSQ